MKLSCLWSLSLYPALFPSFADEKIALKVAAFTAYPEPEARRRMKLRFAAGGQVREAEVEGTGDWAWMLSESSAFRSRAVCGSNGKHRKRGVH
jgi:hypothetical protein